MSAMNPPRERGSATLFAVAVVGVLVLVGAALGVAGAMVHAHRVAQSAADLAALAGAQSLAKGGDACAAAAVIAAGNGVVVDSCVVEGFDVRLQVTAAGPHWLGQRHDLSAQARAGPAGRSALGEVGTGPAPR
jgi:secretion/DNA translocation related TadE-like protein